eukprot:jgi/Ulvmu1/8253/UM041_0064.1
MFYSVQLLGKTSPLGKLWLAAHADKRLKRQDINSTDVPQSVEQIIQSEDNDNQLPLALRLSGLLLLGLVKIYSRQLQYLQEDCLNAVQELDKADRVVGQKGQNKQKSAKAAFANQADVTVPDEPHQLFRFSSLSDEEGFGLFEENHAGLAMAAEAHASFMNLEFSLSQSDAHDESAMVHLDEPEQLRAVPGGFDSEIEPTLAIGDELPRMTPTKRLGGSVSLDISPAAQAAGDMVAAAAAQPDTADEDMLPVPLAMDDLPELPPIVRPSSGHAAQEDSAEPPVTGRRSPLPNMEDEAMNDDQLAMPAVDSLPNPLPEPTPVVAPDSLPDCTAGALPDLMDDVMMDETGIPGHESEANGTTPKDDGEDPVPMRGQDDGEDKKDKHVSAISHTPKRKPIKPTSATTAVGQKVKCKRNAPKLRKDADEGATTIAHHEVRELLKNRSSLICKLPPVVSGSRLHSQLSSTDDLDVLLVPPGARDSSLDQRMARLFEAIGSCRPLSWKALRGNSSATTSVEFGMEHATPVQPAKKLGQVSKCGNACASTEVLRDARASMSGSRGHGAPPIAQAQLSEEDATTRDNMQIGAGRIMNPESADLRSGDDDFPALELPEMGMPDVGFPVMDIPVADAPEMIVPFELPPDSSQPNDNVHHVGNQTAAPEAQHVSDDAHVPEEHTPAETLYSAPTATQGTGCAEDSSLNAHTIRTLEKLEKLTQGHVALKRKLPQHIPMSELIQSKHRPEAAKLFYDVLVLQAKSVIALHEQEEPYAELQMMLNSNHVYK